MRGRPVRARHVELSVGQANPLSELHSVVGAPGRPWAEMIAERNRHIRAEFGTVGQTPQDRDLRYLD